MSDKYKKELDSIRMSESLKQKIKMAAEENPKQKRVFFTPKVLIPVSMACVICFVSVLILPSYFSNEQEPTPIAKAVAFEEDETRMYSPTQNGLIGGMGGNASNDEPDMNTTIKKPAESLPLYTRTSTSATSKDYLAWVNEVTNKLPIDETITSLPYKKEDISIANDFDNTLSIALLNIGHYPSSEINEEMKTIIKEAVNPLIPWKDVTWVSNKTSYTIYKKGKEKTVNPIEKEKNAIHIYPNFDPSFTEGSYTLQLSITIPYPKHLQASKELPVMEESKARNILKRGGYYYKQGLYNEVLPEQIEEEQIQGVEFTYTSLYDGFEPSAYTVPVYRYLVQISEKETRYLDVIALPQKELKKFDQVTWYFQHT